MGLCWACASMWDTGDLVVCRQRGEDDISGLRKGGRIQSRLEGDKQTETGWALEGPGPKESELVCGSCVCGTFIH